MDNIQKQNNFINTPKSQTIDLMIKPMGFNVSVDI
jgi:hypothetical protein